MTDPLLFYFDAVNSRSEETAMNIFDYAETTSGIEVKVVPKYIPEKSSPDNNYYFFAYTVTISNNSTKFVQLLNRHWIICDGNGKMEEVSGPGVVGQQPELKPQQKYTYTSACPLPTPTGNMRGFYEMVDKSGNRFRIKIPLFFLRTPETFH